MNSSNSKERSSAQKKATQHSKHKKGILLQKSTRKDRKDGIYGGGIMS
jgi:hypothetical protein